MLQKRNRLFSCSGDLTNQLIKWSTPPCSILHAETDRLTNPLRHSVTVSVTGLHFTWRTKHQLRFIALCWTDRASKQRWGYDPAGWFQMCFALVLSHEPSFFLTSRSTFTLHVTHITNEISTHQLDLKFAFCHRDLMLEDITEFLRYYKQNWRAAQPVFRRISTVNKHVCVTCTGSGPTCFNTNTY